MTVFRCDFTRRGIGGISTGSGGGGGKFVSGGRGGISSTGRGFSRVMTLVRFFSRSATAAVGGGGNQGSGARLRETGCVMCMLSASDESLSNRSGLRCAIAAVPRLRLPPYPPGRDVTVVIPPFPSPRPHLHSRSLGGAGALRRFQRQAHTTLEKKNSTPRAMDRPQTVLSW